MAYALILILSALNVLIPTKANAFTLSNSLAAAFPGDDVSVNVASHSCTNIGISNDQLLGVIKDAVENYWNSVASSRLRLHSGSLTAVSTAFQTDLICNTGTDCTPNTALTVSSDILVSCNTNSGNFSSGAVLAVTVPNNISDRNINGALILLNDRSDSQFGSKSHQEQVAILAHEIGHAIGLGHSSVEDSLMYYRSVPTRESLGWDDIDGLTYLYPTEQPFSGCGQVDMGKPNPQGPLTLVLGLSLGLFLSRRSYKLKAKKTKYTRRFLVFK